MACPGSIRLSKGIPDTSSIFAQEGTAAHALAELCLTNNSDPSMYVGIELGDKRGKVEVTEDMADFTRVYIDHCNSLAGTGAEGLKGEAWIEKRFNLAVLNPPAPMFGTADFTLYHAPTRTLHVVDLKYGQGVVVEPTTPQTKYYGLGAALSLDPDKFPIDHVTLTIVQPRAAHPAGPVRSITIPYSELVEFAVELMERARATLDPAAPLHPGDHCKFCPAAGVCPAQRDAAQKTAMVDFADMPLDVPPNPETLPIEVLLDIMDKKHILESWLKSLDAVVMRKLEAGEDVPGWKLVARRATRKWADEDTVASVLENEFGEENVYTKKLITPPQAEKLFHGKKKFETAMGDLVAKVSSGNTMARAADPRPAVALSPGQEFDALPASTE